MYLINVILKYFNYSYDHNCNYQKEGSIEENSREYGHVGVTSHVTVK